MATIQDRLRQSRTPLDKWSTREQLCLASAVSCSGDQNWMSVSRTMKLVCGTGVNSMPRPIDWYSQKSCAVQYGHLLENVETTKRKKRTSESSGRDTPAVVETPTDQVLRKLTEERMQELKNEIRKNQEDYANLYKDVKELQAGNCSEERLLAMWQDMEQEEETKRLENVKLENETHEREQRKHEMQRNIRTVSPVVTVSSIKAETANTELKQEIALKNKPPLLNIPSDVTTQQQQQQPQTSPLLSSLLKSPTSSTATVSNTNVPSVARTTAPTITTLLTGGSIPIKQPVVIIKNTDVGQMLTRPASGPPSEIANVAPNLLSPSQSAPTLSLLLEKNKINNVQNTHSLTTVELNTVKVKQEQIDDGNKPSVLPEESKKEEEEVPMEVDDATLTGTANEASSMEIDETDPNEEQQLLEVFKNIGNIELEIDAEFLTAMDEEPATDNADIVENFDNKLEKTVLKKTENIEQDKIETVKKEKEKEEISIVQEDSLKTAKKEEDTKTTVKEEDFERATKSENKEIKKSEIMKVETSSSDDSSDNVPLATVANVLESKEAKASIEYTEPVEKQQQQQEEEQIVHEAENVEIEVVKEEILVEAKEEQICDIKEDKIQINIAEVEEKCMIKKEKAEEKEEYAEKVGKIEGPDEQLLEHKQDIPDIITKADKSKTTKNADPVKEETKPIKSEAPVTEDLDTETETIEIIPITDTDTDSSYTPEVEKNFHLDLVQSVKNERIKTERLISEDSDSTPLPVTPTLPPTVTPARPPALRKLRERDRSESPMIGEEDTEHGSSTSLRLRRRASSTPITDSIPNSPASISDREERELRTASKKSLLNIFKAMQHRHYKQITLLEKSFCESSKPNRAKYEEVCLRPMDFQVIQQNIENGTIRSTLGLQRDILLMCQNAIMLYVQDTEQYRAAMQIKQDCRNLSDLCQFEKTGSEKEHKDREVKSLLSSSSSGTTPNTSFSKSRSGSRKSQRIT